VSFKTEFFSGHWWDDGLYFETREEAVSHGASQKRQFRVKDADETINYRWEDGQLRPGAKCKLPVSWEAYAAGLWNSGATTIITLPYASHSYFHAGDTVEIYETNMVVQRFTLGADGTTWIKEIVTPRDIIEKMASQFGRP